MSIFGKLISTTVRTALLPVEIVKDVATLGGELTDERGPYTGRALKKITKNVEDIFDELED